MARKKSSTRKDSASTGKTPEKTQNEIENSDRRQSRRLSGKPGDELGEYLQSLASQSRKKSTKDDVNDTTVEKPDRTRKPDQTNTSKDMARSYDKYQKYEKLNDTPDHLYGLDGRLMSSDEDADLDVEVCFEETNQNYLRRKIKSCIEDYWKTACSVFLIVFLTGIFTAVLVQVHNSKESGNTEEDHSSETLRKIEKKVDRLSSVLAILAKHSDPSSDNKSLLSEKVVQDIVQAALQRYNADKVGMPDFALESSGAQIHIPHHSDTYDVGAARVVVFGVPLWFDVKPPRVILQPDNSPGNCWALKGQQGYVVIKLSRTLTPTAFTLEHIPKSLSPTGDGKTPSAPKEFAVWAWKDPDGNEREQLGKYIFDSEGDFLQTFKVQVSNAAVQYIELRILSNHGNPKYTCIYRFRVHGNPHQL